MIEKRQEAVLEGHESYVNSVAISRDNKYIVSGSYDQTVRLWNLQKKREEAVFTGHISIVQCIAISRDNRYIMDPGTKL
jgi:WD40 repeat protein